MATVQLRGLAYPLQLDSKGRLELITDLGVIEQNIISVLETRPFERVMRATYGFDPGIFDTMEPNAINAHVAKGLAKQSAPAGVFVDIDQGASLVPKIP